MLAAIDWLSEVLIYKHLENLTNSLFSDAVTGNEPSEAVNCAAALHAVASDFGCSSPHYIYLLYRSCIYDLAMNQHLDQHLNHCKIIHQDILVELSPEAENLSNQSAPLIDFLSSLYFLL